MKQLTRRIYNADTRVWCFGAIFNDFKNKFLRIFLENAVEKMETLKDAVPDTKMTSITEGSAQIVSESHVFYNPVQQFNRDMSLSVLTTYSRIVQAENKDKLNKNDKANCPSAEGLRVLEALSATGLRSIRYAKEVPGIKKIIANDLSASAVRSIIENIRLNNVEHIVEASEANAMTLMYNSTSVRDRFDAIDLDPYGNPTMFLDGAVQSIAEGGLLLVTATDMAVLAGNTPESCLAKYGSIALKTKACHEQALRILLRCIESHATRYGRYIKPLLSISADFYIRVFVRVFTSPLQCKLSSSKQSMVHQCTGCSSLSLQPLGILKPNPTPSNPNQMKYCLPVVPTIKDHCEHCNQKYHMGGPIWSAPIHDFDFVAQLMETIQMDPYTKLVTQPRMLGMLSVIKEELPSVPLYYAVDKLCSVLRLEAIPILKFRSALLHAGYSVSFSHACKSSIKTNAPTKVLWDILRTWAKSHPVNMTKHANNLPLNAILSKEPDVLYNLEELHPDSNPESRRTALARFPNNPTAHWGPGTRATLMLGDKMLKSVQNQNKNKMKRHTAPSPTNSSDAATKQIKMEESA